MSEIFGNGVMGGGGLTNSKLALANAQAADVRSGKKFYAGDKQIKTGTLADVTQATPAITVDAAGKITASATQAAGVVAAGTKSATKQLPVQAAKTVIPSASAQTAVGEGVFTTGIVTVAAVYAVIGVTYPSGSVCTCTNGTLTLTAKDTSGKAIFVIPEAGTWTVTATDGTNTKSESVEITSDGQSVSVELVYEFVLYDNGIMQNGGVVKSIDHESTYGSNSAVVKDGYLYISVANNLTLANGFRSVNAISGGKYNTLKVRVSNVSGNAYFRLAAKKTSDPYNYTGENSSDEYAVLDKTSFTDGEYALDISAVEESAYYGAWIWGKNGRNTQGSCRILRLWLE